MSDVGNIAGLHARDHELHAYCASCDRPVLDRVDSAVSPPNMTRFSQRFAAGSPGGRRSSEWVVAWKDNTSDVYLAGRSTHGFLRASLHELGQCHVHGPSARSQWWSPGDPPRYLDLWRIDPAAPYTFPFAVILPESELRVANWTRHRDRGTVWLPVDKGECAEVGVFFVRSDADQSNALAAAGWQTTLVNARLPDGRRLYVVAGSVRTHPDSGRHVQEFRALIAPQLADGSRTFTNARGVLFSTDANGTRKFIEVAATPES